MTTRKDDRRTPRRARGEDGAALLEFSLIAVLLFTLVFGIISFGLLLSFKQDLTRAAAEGARAGAVAFPHTNAKADATAATYEAVDGFGKACNDGKGLTCTVERIDCSDAGLDAPPADPDGGCAYVHLEYDNDGHPITPPFPLISAFMPGSLEATSVARVNS